VSSRRQTSASATPSRRHRRPWPSVHCVARCQRPPIHYVLLLTFQSVNTAWELQRIYVASYLFFGSSKTQNLSFSINFTVKSKL
jgi:hypothetical protein